MARDKLQFSEYSMKEIKSILTRAGADLRRVMEIAQVDSMRISLDLNEHIPGGKFMGVKITALKMQEAEVVYDEDPER